MLIEDCMNKDHLDCQAIQNQELWQSWTSYVILCKWFAWYLWSESLVSFKREEQIVPFSKTKVNWIWERPIPYSYEFFLKKKYMESWK